MTTPKPSTKLSAVDALAGDRGLMKEAPQEEVLADPLALLDEGVRVSSRRKFSPERQMAVIAVTFRLIRSAIA